MIKESACRGALLAITCLPVLLLSFGCSVLGNRYGESRAASLRERILLPKVVGEEDGIGIFRKTVIPDRPITLEEAVAIALANNHSVKISAEDVDIANSHVGVARSLFFPQVTGSYGFARSELQPAMVDPNNPLMPPFYAGEKEFQRAELKVQMILWDFGRTLGTYRQAVLAREIAELRSTRNEQLVRLQVTEAYFNVLRAKKGRSIVEESLSQVEAHLKTARSFHKQGMVDKSDVLRAELYVAQVRQALIKIKNAVELSTSALNLALGVNVNRKTEVVDTEEVPTLAATLEESLHLAVDNRPEFQVVQKAIQIQEQALNVARAGHLPRIYVGGGYNWTDDAYRKWGGGSSGKLSKGAWAGEIGIQIDLFTGGRTSAKTRIAHSKIRQAEEQARQLCDAIVLQVKSGVLGIAEARERISVAKKAVAQAKEHLRLINNKYRQNMASSTDVVDAETALSQAQGNYYSAIYDCHTALARLLGAVGINRFEAQKEETKPEGGKQ